MTLAPRWIVVFVLALLTGCNQPVTESRAPGQPTMTELMHLGANQQKAEEEKRRERRDRVQHLTPEQVAGLEASLRTKPDDLQVHEDLFTYYLAEKNWPKFNPHLLWAIDNAAVSPLMNHVPDPAENPKGYAAGKRSWLARLKRQDDATTAGAVRYLIAGDKELAETILIERMKTDRKQMDWTGLLANVYYQVLVGSQGPLPQGVVRSVSLAHAHGPFAEKVRRKLDQTRDANLLAAVARLLMNTGLHRGGALDFDARALGTQYKERAIALEPDPHRRRSYRGMLDHLEVQQRVENILRSGTKVEDLLKTIHDRDRWYVFPMVIRLAEIRADQSVLEDLTRQYLEFAKSRPDDPRYDQMIYQANMQAGKLALRERDRRRAADHLLAAVDTAGHSELRYYQMDMTLARSLVDWGERETVAKFLDQCAQRSYDSARYKAWAADIRKGINPNLTLYQSGG